MKFLYCTNASFSGHFDIWSWYQEDQYCNSGYIYSETIHINFSNGLTGLSGWLPYVQSSLATWYAMLLSYRSVKNLSGWNFFFSVYYISKLQPHVLDAKKKSTHAFMEKEKLHPQWIVTCNHKQIPVLCIEVCKYDLHCTSCSTLLVGNWM